MVFFRIVAEGRLGIFLFAGGKLSEYFLRTTGRLLGAEV